MQSVKLRKKFTLVTLCLMLLLAGTLIPHSKASAGSDNLLFKMPNGGSWKYTVMDANYVKKMGWSNHDFRVLEVVHEMTYLSPATVQIMANDLGNKVGLTMTKQGLKLAVETAASSGITAAKQKLTAKYGASTAAKFIPYLNFFAWSYTAYDLFSTINEGRSLQRLTDAAKQGKGLIYKNKTNGHGDGWYLWDGSSSYGEYPYAKLNPNKYQLGKVTIN
ncbi:hypothetical protein [Paenibacillus xylanexedens]|uniref:hypothetical protein n=1 Tax=Paenibacillus xylanexedens TaxID=528191 RepID=UPI0011A74759|nr:hypothetical protein [Paenibacillus xylanexedens]